MSDCIVCSKPFRPSDPRKITCSETCRVTRKNEVTRQWRADNPEQVKANSRNWRLDHPGRQAELTRAWRERQSKNS